MFSSSCLPIVFPKKKSNQQPPGPMNLLPTSVVAKILECFTTQEVRLCYSKVNRTFYEAMKLCRVISPIFPNDLFLTVCSGQLLSAEQTYLLENDREKFEAVLNSKIAMMVEFYKTCPDKQTAKKCLARLEQVKKKMKPMRLLAMEYSHAFTIFENRLAEEGVSGGDHLMTPVLRQRLVAGIDKLERDPLDRRNLNIRGIVNPRMYPYVEGISRFVPSQDLPQKPEPFREIVDMFGRTAESASIFQFLPTYIDEVENGRWRFRNEINNLPRPGNETLYEDLETLFSACVPHFEAAIWYANTLAPKGGKSSFELCAKDYRGDDCASDCTIATSRETLNGKSLQVIISIADFELQPGQTYEGLFHVDCMPEEHIVAVADVTISKDDHFRGGGLFFKRGFLRREIHTFVDHLFLDQQELQGLLPLGKVSPKEGRVTVFPNTHIHRLLPATNASTSSVAKRRNLIFFVVNPNERIISTQEVPTPQHDVISKSAALKFRDEIVQERKVQDWNVLKEYYNPLHASCMY
jgi:hypothetical protein